MISTLIRLVLSLLTKYLLLSNKMHITINKQTMKDYFRLKNILFTCKPYVLVQSWWRTNWKKIFARLFNIPLGLVNILNFIEIAVPSLSLNTTYSLNFQQLCMYEHFTDCINTNVLETQISPYVISSIKEHRKSLL